MPASKLKNLAILILLLANLALVALLVPGRLAQRQEQNALRDSLSQLCAAQDVALDPGVIPQDVTLYALELAEDAEADRKAAEVLLGQELTQGVATRYRRAYSSPLGQFTISSRGDLQAQLTGRKPVSNMTSAAKQTLKQMGFSSTDLSEPRQIQAAVYTIAATPTVLDAPIFSSGLTLTYTDGILSGVDGVFFTGTGSLTRVSEEACCSAADALVEFLSARYALGWVGSSITGMTQGYLRAETAAAAAVHLTPVWRITTDTGAFYVNGMTLDITPAN